MSEAVMEAEKAAAKTHSPVEAPPKRVTPSLSGRAAVLAKYGLHTLQEIVDTDYPQTSPLVENLLSPGETALLIARQKEGKSTLALQLVVDIACGNIFLDRFKTGKTSVLYVDYENRPHRLKDRGKDIAKGRPLNDIIQISFDLISDRNVGLFGESLVNLQKIVSELKPGLLVIDPLRYAMDRDCSDERNVIQALDNLSAVRSSNPEMAVLLIHHLKKAQDNFTPQLRTDPSIWIERVYGSQALLAHAETIWGLEHDDSGYAFGTVSRSEDSFVLGLEKEEESQRFQISAGPIQIAGMTLALRDAWEKLPTEFSRTEGLALVPNNTLDRLIRHCRPIGLLTQDPKTKRYKKAC